MMDIVRALVEIMLYSISGLSFRKNNRIIFGAWNGERYADNSRYMLECLSKSQKYELIWCGKKEIKSQIPVKPNIIFVEHGSLKSYYYAATAKYAFITHSQNDIGKYNVLNGAEIIQLWHGIGIKSLGAFSSKEPTLIDKMRTKVSSIVRNYDYFICSSEQNKDRNLTALKPYGINPDNVICSGQPRNDIFFDYDDSMLTKIREEYRDKYSIPEGKKIITYLPTFRENKERCFSFFDIDGEVLKEMIEILVENNAIILEKVHQQDKDMKTSVDSENPLIYDVSHFDDINTQELLLISDLLITDYSSCYMDYVLLDRPIVHFAYDYEEYNKDGKGLYYELSDIAAGEIVSDVDGLLDSIQSNLEDVALYSDRRKNIRNTMMEYEQGHSCDKIKEFLGIY